MKLACSHWFRVVERDEKDDRIRTFERCEKCGAEQYGCYAKRLDTDGRPAWGPVGRWGHYPAAGVVT